MIQAGETCWCGLVHDLKFGSAFEIRVGGHTTPKPPEIRNIGDFNANITAIQSIFKLLAFVYAAGEFDGRGDKRSFYKTANEEALSKVNYRQFASLPGMVKRIAAHLVDSSGRHLVWAEGVLRNVLVLGWTAFEVLAGDLWSAVDVARPHLRAALQRKEINALGFRSRKKIRDSYQAFFKVDTGGISNALSPTSIDALAILRNAMVHAGGKADAFFIKERNGIPEIAQFGQLVSGDKIPVDGDLCSSLVNAVSQCAAALVEAVDNWLLTHP